MDGHLTHALEQLRPDSGIRIITGVTSLNMYLQYKGIRPNALIDPKLIANGHWDYVPRQGNDPLKDPSARRSVRKIITLPAATEDNLTSHLNTALLGGRDYPVLSALMGVGAGAVSGAAGLIFSAGSTALSLAKKSHKILARAGDEIWHVEEIGRTSEHGKPRVVHVSSYFLLDPYRNHGTRRSWLIHEDRKTLAI